MNPIKNKKDLEATIEDIRSFAYSYLEKYSPSKQQLKTYLFKKAINKNLKIKDKNIKLNFAQPLVKAIILYGIGVKPPRNIAINPYWS